MSQADWVSWLLDAATPSIRYLTLCRLMARGEDDPDVQAARRAMSASGPIPVILARQTEMGNWAGERSYYTPKYVSTHWSMMLLAELAADGSDPRMRRGATFMLGATQAELNDKLAKGKSGGSCFWGNVLRYAVHCGLSGDARVRAIVRYLVHDGLEAGWRCPINDDVPCAWGAARALWGLAALPAEQHTPEVRAAIQKGLAFLLEEHHLIAADYPTPGKIHPLWFRLNFPLFFQADILFTLRVVGEHGALGHPGAQPALAWLRGRRQSSGQWQGASPFRQQTWEALTNRAEVDRWVSLHAAVILS